MSMGASPSLSNNQSAASRSGDVQSRSAISPYAPVFVDQTGINIGEILKELNTASPENGGYATPEGVGSRMLSFLQGDEERDRRDVNAPSLSIGGLNSSSTKTKTRTWMLVGGAVVALALVTFLLKRSGAF